MRHLVVTLHLIGLYLHDRVEHTQAAYRNRSERGSVTIEQVAWAVALIAIVTLAAAAIRAYVVTQTGKLG